MIGGLNDVVLRRKEQEHKAESSEHHSDVNIIVRLCDVDCIKVATIESTGHPNESVEAD